MCFRLVTQRDTVGALNLCSRTVGVFDVDDRDHGSAPAAHAALATVAKATGILMERFDIDADRAFAVLRRVSQDSSRKLREVARELVITRSRPPRPPRPGNTGRRSRVRMRRTCSARPGPGS